MKLKPLMPDGREAYGSAKIDEHRMIIVGGFSEDGDAVGDDDDDLPDRTYLSSAYIYDVRTEQSTPLRNDQHYFIK